MSFYLFSHFSVLAQSTSTSYLYDVVDAQPDSVRAIVNEILTKSTDVRLISEYFHLIGLSYQADGDLDQSNQYFFREDSMFQFFKPSLDQLIQNDYEIADNFYYKGDLTKSDSMLQELIPSLPKVRDYRLRCNVLLNAGWLSRERGRHAEALDYYFEANKLAELNKDKGLLADGYAKMAVVYAVMREWESAKKYYDKAFEIYEQLNDLDRIARLYNNYGLLYMEQRMPYKAIPFFERSIEMCDSLGNTRGVAIANENMGLLCYEDLENYTLALEKFRRSLDVWRSFDDAYGQAQTLVYAIYVHNAQGNWAAAIDSGYKSLDFCLVSGAKDVERDLYKEMSIAYEGQGNAVLALEFYKKHISLRDSLKTDNKLDEIQKMEIRSELEMKQVKDSLSLAMEHQAASAEIESKMREQRLWSGIMAFGLVGFIVIALLIFRGSQQRKKNTELVKKAHLLLKTKNEEIIDSITYAKRIQEAILPSPQMISSLLKDSFIFYLPKDIVAGDFYWIEKVVHKGSEKVLFAVADCTGHGVPGAMVSVVCSNALNKAVHEMNIHDPGEILEAVTKIVTETFANSGHELKDGMDVSLISMSQEGSRLHLEYAGANNSLWIIRKNAGEVEEIKATKRPVGKYMVDIPFETQTVRLKENDSIYLFTDGYADQFGGEKNKKFKYQTLKKLLLDIHEKSPEEQRALLAETFSNWKGAMEQIDDVCIAGIRV